MTLKKRIRILIAVQVIFTSLQVYLISKISLIGKIGIDLFYTEYSIFRYAWKTYLLFFGIQLVIIVGLSAINKKYSKRAANITSAVLLVIALIGLWYSYNDFLHTYSHRLLKEKFHLGFYLFWLGWICTCVFFMFLPGRKAMRDPELVPAGHTIEDRRQTTKDRGQ